MLQELHDHAPADHFTLGWLMRSLHKQSFGMIMLLLAIIAAAPGICMVAGLLLMIPALQMIAGRPAPTFPRWIADRPLPTRHIDPVVQRAIRMLKYLEKIIYPRYPTPPEVTKRLPALLIAQISLAYLEEDGLMLSIGLLAAFIVLALDLGVVWMIVHGAKWIGISV
jgi:hypothetical protein